MDESLEKLDALSDLFFEAVQDPGRWKDCLDAAATFARCRGVVILPIQGRAPNAPASAEAEDLIKSYFAEEWCFRDERDKGLYRFNLEGITVDQDYVTPEFMETSSYYNDFIGRNGFKWFAGLEIKVGADRWAIAFQRTAKQGMFTVAEQELLKELRPRLSHALTLSYEIDRARMRTVEDLVALMKLPSFAFDRVGRVLVSNKAAESLFTNGPLRLKNGLIECATTTLTLGLRAHIDAAIWGDFRPGHAHPDPFILRTHGRRPILIDARRLSGPSSHFFSSARGVATIVDLNATAPVDEAMLVSALSLTPAEARVAGLVGTGHTTQELQALLGVSAETIRSHLKQIRLKTSVRKQSELALLLSKLSML